MSEVELQTLADDIKAHGQRDPVLLIGASGSASRSEDQVIDGRNRLLACELAGFEPEVSWCDGDIDPIAFVLSKNLHRRHLTASQRAMIALDVEKMYAEQAKEQERTRADDGQFIQGAKNI